MIDADFVDRPSAAAGGGTPIDRRLVRLVVLALATGVALDIGLRGGPANAVVVLGVLLLVAALAGDRWIEGGQARGLAAAALVPAAFLALRLSPWLLASNLVAVAGLIGAGVALARSGSIVDVTPSRLLRRVELAALRSLAAPAVVRPLVPRSSGPAMARAARVGAALLVAVPLLAVVAALLAASDAVFAGLLVPDIDLAPLVGHAALAGLLAFAVVGVAAAALSDADDQLRPGVFGALEVSTMLALAWGVVGLFVVSQVVALTDAGKRLIESSGLTPAEYARSGFFQLCWATAVLLGFLALVRALAAPGVMARPVVRVLGGGLPVLALGLVAVSLRRMALYDQAFGLTMLRLWVVGAAVWMAAVLVMTALRNAGVGGGRNWVLSGAVAVALMLVLAADLASPEAFVVRHNVQRADDGAELDAAYLVELSDDAVPTLVGVMQDEGRGPGPLRRQLVEAVGCGEDRTGVAALNLAARRAADARSRLCAG